MEFGQVAASLNLLRGFLASIMTKSAENRSVAEFKKEFKIAKISERDSRDLERIWTQLTDFVLEELYKKIINVHSVEFTQAETETALRIVGDIIKNNSINADYISAYSSNPIDSITRLVAKAGAENKLAPREASALRFALSTFMEIVKEIYLYVPVFEIDATSLQIASLKSISSKIDDVQDTLGRIDAATARAVSTEDSEYERLYRRYLVQALDNLPVAGLGSTFEAPDLPLSIGYIDIETAGATRMLTNVPLLLSGGAGQGKTSLLKFMVTQSAINRLTPKRVEEARLGENLRSVLEFVNEHRDVVPFFVRLRDHSEISVDNFTDIVSAIGAPPPGWTRNVLANRPTIIIFDGVDEVSETLRKQCKELIQLLTSSYEDCVIIASGRPLAIEGFGRNTAWQFATMTPLSLSQQLKLVSRWFLHATRYVQHSDVKSLDRARTKLTALLTENRSFSSIASSPLVCAALCLLSASYKGGLPTRLYDICGALTTMLLLGRDRENGVPFRDSHGRDILIGAAEVEYILKSMASQMILRRTSSITLETLSTMMTDSSIRPVNLTVEVRSISAIVERVGLIRFHSDQSIEFIHNVFKEFFAVDDLLAGSLSDSLDELITDEGLQNSVLIACETPRFREISPIIDAIVNIYSNKKRRFTKSEPFSLFLYSCLLSLSFEQEKWNRCMEELERKFVPPKNAEQAQVVAKGGPKVAKRLSYHPGDTPQEMAMSIRSLGLMSHEAAVDALMTYRDSTNKNIMTELLRFINPLSINIFLKEIIETGTLSGDILVRLTSLGPLFETERPSIKILDISNSSVHSLDGIENLPNIEIFNASGSLVREIHQLAHCHKLREVRLTMCPISSVDELFKLRSIEVIDIDYTNVSSLPKRHELKNLRILNIRRGASDE